MLLINKSLYGLILGGGRSSRMGRDKGLIVYHGKPQREHLSIMLDSFCEKVFISCESSENVPDHLHPLPDRFSVKGPLNGILSALDSYPSTAWLSLPVDMPDITAEDIRYLLQHRDVTKVATCYYDSDGTLPEPLFTVWEPQAFPLLQAFYKAGKISPREFLRSHPIKIVKSQHAGMHTNINSPEALARYFRGLRDQSV